eukprot:TRINITY_DN9033_c0_g1_i1.p1 TRINITY_DN9033_c0_g1~~TRINITY_DN9033_c0_g1_i1.p1  ORF type:complete len:169 (-),score=28.29 TRINITY_DN9033_c0_g1_i1:45-551(-)
MPRQRECFCGKEGANQCSGCKSVFYCGKDHQKEHWSRHKADCKIITQMVADQKPWHKVVLQAGAGDVPRRGRQVLVRYKGSLTTGSVFDATEPTGEPFSFNVGVGEVIRGWDEGVLTMRKGEKARLYITHEYAYGKAGAGPIPPAALLIFDIEVVDIPSTAAAAAESE